LNFADELIGLHVAVLVATGGAHLAAKAATASVPIVCGLGADPIKFGLAESIKRRGCNLTGMSVVTADLEAKRLEMLHEAVSKDAEIGVLVDSNYIDLADQIQEVERTVRVLGRAARIVHAGADNELDAAFAKLSELRVGGIVVTGSPFFNNRRDRLLALSARFGGPVIYENREFTAAGRIDELRHQSARRLSPDRRLYRPRPQRGEARRPANPFPDGLRHCHQPEDGKGARA
jgi:putative tryptophan/tyrosine transport system substrate-binding protein